MTALLLDVSRLFVDAAEEARDHAARIDGDADREAVARIAAMIAAVRALEAVELALDAASAACLALARLKASIRCSSRSTCSA